MFLAPLVRGLAYETMMLTSDDQVPNGEVLEIALTHGDEPPVTLRFTSDSYPPVQAAWKRFERERGERIDFKRFFELLLDKSAHRQQAEQRPQSCAMCGGPWLE